MRRWALGGGAIVVAGVLLLLASAGAATVALSGESLGHVLGDDRHATVADLDGGGVRVTAPPGTAVLALASGHAHVLAGGAVELRGEGNDADVVVTYANATPPVPDNEVTAGAAIGVVPASGSLDVTVALRGSDLDVRALIEDDVSGVADDAGAAVAPGAMARPVAGAAITQGFGCTAVAIEPADPGCPGGRFHAGVDLAAPLGTPVRAALGGRVHVVRTIGGYGLRVEITSAGGLLTLYGHLLDATVADGDVVATGDPIGSVGSSGNSTGPHLHFEVRRNGVAEDPRVDVALP